VQGTTHTNAIQLGGSTTGIEVIGGNYQSGTAALISNNNGANKIFTPPAPSNGWGTPTGNGVQNNFAGIGATLASTGEALAQVIIVLKQAGILNA
jgi:hypothetical protein